VSSSKIAICDLKRFEFIRRELKRKIVGEAFAVAAQLFIQPFRGYAINPRKIDIEHHPLVANGKNSDVLRFVFHPADRSILSFPPARSSRRYQLLVGWPLDAASICDRIFMMLGGLQHASGARSLELVRFIPVIRGFPKILALLAGGDARR
jgi:hypothetical protein